MGRFARAGENRWLRGCHPSEARSIAGPPGNPIPRKRATLSNASPAASSMVSPTVLYSPQARACTIWVCPRRQGTRSLAVRMGVLQSGCEEMPLHVVDADERFVHRPGESLAVRRSPTINAPTRPGPLVAATASTSSWWIPASRRARWVRERIASTCARAATSGTTPPNRACSSTCDDITLESITPSRTTPTAVSSHEVSNPITVRTRLIRPPGSDREARPMRGRIDIDRPHDDGVLFVLVVARTTPHRREPETLVEAVAAGSSRAPRG